MDLLSAMQSRGKVEKIGDKDGGEYASACPYCQDGKDRFHLWPLKNRFWCRQCGKTGDLIQFLRDIDNLSFREAAEAAGKDLTSYQAKRRRPVGPVAATTAPPAPAYVPHAVSMPSETWCAQSAKLIEWAHAHLLGNRAQLDYLAGRGLDIDAVRRFGLGWIPGNPKTGAPAIYRQRSAWGLERIEKPDGKPKMLWIPRGLVLPAFGPDGFTPRRIRIRRPPEDVTPQMAIKYYVLPGSDMAPLSILSRNAKAWVVVEAELDAMLLAGAGGRLLNVLGLGSSVTRPDAETDAALAEAHAILLSLDADTPGAEACAWWESRYRRTRRHPVPQGKDPGEAYSMGCDLRRWLYTALPASCRLELTLDMPSGGGAQNWDESAASDQIAEDIPAGGAAENKEAAGRAEAGLPDVAAGVKKLFALVSDYPIWLLNNDKHTSIRTPAGWQDATGAVRQASRLVFFDAAVMAWMDAHPSERIDRGNFWKTENN